ncbi:hypothetical protein [Tenuibacillus multivorans]|uniref:Uncharacterized protein n=1 Tax=Tenuibacillus multivorans TaxID=237069 RepID=A0A1G9Z3J2_9BACI|nr:hypothetical protein [Tenuibacillus multivorans]GEL77421.1 hypothetical protein TMU01_16560 [Tenuibacillus multivorans]SDN15932.1 hypothetical protein SAMN05216498_1516 [Tenuibacillus multivorans]
MQFKLNPTVIRGLAIVLGIIGSFIGAYHWWNFHIPEFWSLNETDHVSRKAHYRQTEMAYLILFFVPACISFIGSIIRKSYLLFIAFLLSLPVGEYITIKTLHFPLYLYLTSAVLFLLINIQKIK